MCKLRRFIRCQDCGIPRNYIDEIKRKAKCCEKYAKHHFVQGLNISEMCSAADVAKALVRARRREREREISSKVAALGEDS